MPGGLVVSGRPSPALLHMLRHYLGKLGELGYPARVQLQVALSAANQARPQRPPHRVHAHWNHDREIFRRHRAHRRPLPARHAPASVSRPARPALAPADRSPRSSEALAGRWTAHTPTARADAGSASGGNVPASGHRQRRPHRHRRPNVPRQSRRCTGPTRMGRAMRITVLPHLGHTDEVRIEAITTQRVCAKLRGDSLLADHADSSHNPRPSGGTVDRSVGKFGEYLCIHGYFAGLRDREVS